MYVCMYVCMHVCMYLLKEELILRFRKVIMRYKRIGYNINVMRQSACLVVNPITVDSFASLFNCTPVGRASDSMMDPTQKLIYSFI